MYVYTDSPWPYTRAVFRLTRDDRAVTFEIEPAAGEVHLTVTGSGSPIVDLGIVGIVAVTVDRARAGREALNRDFPAEALADRFVLHLKPEISIEWAVGRH